MPAKPEAQHSPGNQKTHPVNQVKPDNGNLTTESLGSIQPIAAVRTTKFTGAGSQNPNG